ncbi:ribosomal protection-like ABC-F family protein [Alkaliphilus peptidifermentans]|uniref:Macrolide transport system ATP-binding/permease protein n=1 Tax=Alkaliphilus peptidifermentans DSM 18978 TaxID=1120976 RepID=A0A1G5BPL9_9FIRM|nr:ABC-F type ribosomal protection protein [Alkaliphilus peptidifermentans]SCX92155.1 macrolide transport system ATP-binding/permease protein [Alkaliphilus peptidifermentans DSM 18978]
MLLIECSKIKKYYCDRLILDIDNLKIYSEDRIGIVGANGVGKTTLMSILSKRLEPDEGWVKLYGSYSYITQMEEPRGRRISEELASKFGVESTWRVNMSGGEKTRFKLAEALGNDSVILFADEPTSNVDMEGIQLMEERFHEYKGGLIVIAHDRGFLDKLCNKILEIENGKIKIYQGNYSHFRDQKMKERERAEIEYDAYMKEKRRLEEVINHTKQKVKNIRKAPIRMGNSEARLHKMGNQKAKVNREKAVKNVEKRIEHLESKDKPKKEERIKLGIMDTDRIHSKIIIEGKNLNKTFGNKIIFNDAEFNIYNGYKIALIGSNGCGKSTLIKMIMENDEGIKVAQGAKIGYFSQDMDILDEKESIIENIMESSIYPENFARLLLARLLFKGEAVYKKIAVLSGGERVKVSFAKILLQDINLLVLDEPTNFIDINVLEVIEEELKDYDRTLLFVSHDRSFVDAVASHIMTIENHKIKVFPGNYKAYLTSKEKFIHINETELEKRIFILKNRLSEVVGRLSMPSKTDDIVALDKEYHEILGEIEKLKER